MNIQVAVNDLDKQGRPFRRFSLGTFCWTAGVNDKMAEDAAFSHFVLASVKRHLSEDWGDLCAEDKALNACALRFPSSQGRLFSKYIFNPETSIYIITEWDRSVTTILFPDEY